MSDTFTQKMELYRDMTNSVCLQGTTFRYGEDDRLVDWAYFYPHPVFFLLLAPTAEPEPLDVSDIYAYLEKKGYTVYESVVDGKKDILEEAVHRSPPFSMLYVDSPVEHIVDAAEQRLLDRSTPTDFAARYYWKCGEKIYKFSEAVPPKYRGSSFASFDTTHVIKYSQGLLFDKVLRPEKVPVTAVEQFHASLEDKVCSFFHTGPGFDLVKEVKGKDTFVSYQEILRLFRASTFIPRGVLKVTLYDAIVEFMQKNGFQGRCVSGDKGRNLKKNSPNIKYFFRPADMQQEESSSVVEIGVSDVAK